MVSNYIFYLNFEIWQFSSQCREVTFEYENVNITIVIRIWNYYYYAFSRQMIINNNNYYYCYYMKSLATFSCCFQSLPEWTAVQHRRKSYVVRTKRLIRTGVPCSPVVFLWLITDSVNWTVMWMTRRYVGFKENTFVRLCTLQVAQIMLSNI